MTSLNCQSIKNKTFKVLSYLKDSNVKIACLQETWLRPTDKSTYAIFKDFGYKLVKKERTELRGGGLVIIHPFDLKMKRVFLNSGKSFTTFEYLCCSFTWSNQLVKVVNIYRLPYSEKHRCTMHIKDVFG